jgi:hypothetical protein
MSEYDTEATVVLKFNSLKLKDLFGYTSQADINQVLQEALEGVFSYTYGYYDETITDTIEGEAVITNVVEKVLDKSD